MLETKELVKIYKPKKGVPVTALDKVSLKFGETGMVFLLGKSGSGKSTLLNLLGGLDKYDGGEIVIKGVSSKDFKQKHFDSYRNTYVGFIFQEYNVLDDFTVGANIALAIELQNRKATDSEINEILKEVDLEGFGARKPNELSGGQKQRVAIARALVKKPQIIMADEPTGALDSNTGKQIFDTLKKLSREKLVIVVSHDREFAENYADRIIELSDGKVISDVEYDADFIENNENELLFNGNTIEIPEAYHITEQDRVAINEYIKSLKGKATLNINGTISNKRFKATDQSKIVLDNGSAFKLIKSKLPLKNAFKIGGSSLKYKKIRLAITILLSCISFGLFGLSDTFGAYNHVTTCTNSLVDSKVNYVSVSKSRKVGEGRYSYWRDYGFYLSNDELNTFGEKTNVEMHGVYEPYNSDLDFSSNIDSSVKFSETEFDIYNTCFSGFATINNDILNGMGFKVLAGALPDGNKDEIAISEYVFEIFKKAGYSDGKTTIKNAKGEVVLKYDEVNDYLDILGKYIKINGKNYWITAIIDTGFDLDRYIPLTEKSENKTNAEQLVDYILYNEFDFAARYSYASVIMTGDGFVDRLIASEPKISNITKGYLSFYGDSYGVDSQYIARLSDMKDEKIVWLDGEKKTLGEKEIIATTDVISFYESEETTEVEYENEQQKISAMLKNAKPLSAFKDYFFGKDEDERYVDEEGYKVVGFIVADNTKTKIESTVVCADSLYNEFADGLDNKYSFAVGSMPKDKENIRNLVSYCYEQSENRRFPIQNSVTYELDSIDAALKEVSKIFLYIGIGFALFAALMLSNFIGTSISYKKQEIGILRAIGSRSNDVFRIFFAESFIIAMINFTLSALGTFTVTAVINYVIRNQIGILITILNFDLRQIVLLLGVSILVAFIASYIPVKRIASKRPIDAIRGR